MSVQFGTWNFSGLPASRTYIRKVGEMLSPYGPDGGGTYAGPSVDIIYKAFHTTSESRREHQPCFLPSGAVLTWDGRLDNRDELIAELGSHIKAESPDSDLVAAGYEYWGIKVFAKLLGDWAMSIWNPREQALILAKDFLGTRQLYYSREPERITWSTVLDPLVLLANKHFSIDKAYLAGWLTLFPAVHLTPYVGIRAVPPCTFIRLTSSNETLTRYWKPEAIHPIRYRSAAEYEEHFRNTFSQALQRRLRSDRPVLAELSGGMDSSAIVCVADEILSHGNAEAPRLETVSYYDDTEPNWNERPFFTLIEKKRGCEGLHIDFSAEDAFAFESTDRFTALPVPRAFGKGVQEFRALLEKNGSRVVLSGIGGDEVTGGIPDGIPEIADHIVKIEFRALVSSLKRWAIHDRRPWFHLLGRALAGFVFESAGRIGRGRSLVPSWASSRCAHLYRRAITGYPHRLRVSCGLPSLQLRVATLDGLRRQLASSTLRPEILCEMRYPFLDRTLLEFLYAIPPEQLLRPGERRSLMRRSLSGIVPAEILARRRKSYVARQSAATLQKHARQLSEQISSMALVRMGMVDPERLRLAIDGACRGSNPQTVPLARTFLLENWLGTTPVGAGFVAPTREAPTAAQKALS